MVLIGGRPKLEVTLLPKESYDKSLSYHSTLTVKVF